MKAKRTIKKKHVYSEGDDVYYQLRSTSPRILCKILHIFEVTIRPGGKPVNAYWLLRDSSQEQLRKTITIHALDKHLTPVENIYRVKVTAVKEIV